MGLLVLVVEGNVDIMGRDVLWVHKVKLLPHMLSVISWKRYPKGSKNWVMSAVKLILVIRE
jgi:hypothetical protein